MLTVSNRALSIPASVTIASGATTATFNYTASLNYRGAAILTGTLGGTTESAVITIAASGPSVAGKVVAATLSGGDIAPIGLSCDRPFLAGGRQTTCELRLNAPGASESTEVAISSSTSALRVPTTIAARAEQSRIRFEIGADPAASSETAILQARLGSTTIQSSIALEPSDTPDLVVPNEPLATPQSPIRFTVTASDSRGLTVNLAASGLPPGASFDPASGVLQWTPTNRDLGFHEIALTATNSLGGATTKTVKLFVDSGLPVVTKLENGAGSSAPAGCSPGSVATLRGRSLFAGAIPASDPSGASIDLGGTRVLVNGGYAAVLYASADRVDLLCPAAAAGTPLAIAIETAAGQSKSLNRWMQAAAPGLFQVDDSGAKQAWAIRSGSLDLAAIPNPRFSGKPALPGDRLAFRATGIACTPETAISLRMNLDSYVVPLTELQPLAGHAGVCQILVSVPFGVVGDAVPVTLQFLGTDGRTTTSNQTTISVAARQ
jgi:uncharacterized protein (TIGR03437 family)